MSRLSCRDRRVSILNAARKALAKRGFLATRAEDIARAAGVSAALLFRYFRTLRAIQQAVVARELGRPPLPPAKNLSQAPPRAALETLATVLGEGVNRDPDGLRLALFGALADVPGATTLLRRYVLRVERPLAALLRTWRSKRWIRAGIDAAGFSQLISHALLFQVVTGLLFGLRRRFRGFNRVVDGAAMLLGLQVFPEPERPLSVSGRVDLEAVPSIRKASMPASPVLCSQSEVFGLDIEA